MKIQARTTRREIGEFNDTVPVDDVLLVRLVLLQASQFDSIRLEVGGANVDAGESGVGLQLVRVAEH